MLTVPPYFLSLLVFSSIARQDQNRNRHFLKTGQSKKKKKRPEPHNLPRPLLVETKKKKNRMDRIRRNAAEEKEEEEKEPPAHDDPEEDGEGQEEETDATGKKAKKQQKKAGLKQAKGDARMEREIANDRKKEKEDKRKEEQQAKQEERERIEREKAEEEKEKEDEKKKKEEEEFDKWKDMFSTEQEGAETQDAENESQGLLGEFIDYIKSHKVVILDEIATEFNLRTTDALNRIKSLEECGRISGVLDDRGKFFYISPEEMSTVADFIKNKGRVTIMDMVDACNELITLTPDPKLDSVPLLSQRTDEDTSKTVTSPIEPAHEIDYNKNDEVHEIEFE